MNQLSPLLKDGIVMKGILNCGTKRAKMLLILKLCARDFPYTRTAFCQMISEYEAWLLKTVRAIEIT